MKYYVRVGDENQGPFTLEELQHQGLEPTSYVWHEGLGDWILASQVPELRGILPAIDSGLPQSTYQPPGPIPYSGGHFDADIAEPIGHSGYGIASCILWLGTIVAFVVIMVAAGIMFPNMDAIPENPENFPPELFAIGCATCSLPLVCLLGLGLGIAGVFQAQRKKFFSISGILLNGLVVLVLLGLFIVGFMEAMAAGAP